MENKKEKQLIEQQLILCNDICNRLINYIKNEEYDIVNAIFSSSIKEFDNLGGLLVRINKRYKNFDSINIGAILFNLVESPNFKVLGYLLENELLVELNSLKSYFESNLILDEQFKIEIKQEIKKEITVCKVYIDTIILHIDIKRYEKINSLLEKFIYRILRANFFIDIQHNEIIKPNILNIMLKFNIKSEDLNLLKSILQDNFLPEINRIENLLGLTFIPKDEDLLSARCSQYGQGSIFLEKDQVEIKKILLDKLATGEYKEEHIKCNCGADDYTVISKIDRHGVPISQVICKECGLVYLNPRMNQETYNDFYDKYYRKLYSSIFNFPNRKVLGDNLSITSLDRYPEETLSPRTIEFNIFSLLGDILKTKKLNILEVGFGNSNMLEKLKSCGHNVTGIDLDSNCVNIAKNKGLNVIHAHTTDLIKDYSGKFDLIITTHVVEHFLDLDEELSNIKKLLKADGQFYVEVPGITSYGYDFLLMFQNAHTYFFNLSTLNNVLNRNGFELVRGTEIVTALYKINENIKPQIDINNYQNTLEYMKVCENYLRLKI